MVSRQLNNTSSTLRNIRITFFICYLATRPTLGHCRGDNGTHPMLINAFLSGFEPEVTVTLVTKAGFRRLAERLVGVEFVQNVCSQPSNLFATVLSTRLLSSKMCLGHRQISVMKLLCVNSYKYSKF